MMVRIFLSVFAVLVLVAPAYAADINQLDGQVAVSEDAVKDAADLNAIMQDILADLEEADQRHFLGIYHSYALLGTVETVWADVGRAVDSCKTENPVLTAELEATFAEWTDAVGPVLKDADGQIKNMVLAQDYAASKTLNAFLKDMDTVRKKTAESIETVPVTTEKACKKLVKTMGKTQENLVAMLQETLVGVLHSLSEKPEEVSEEAE